jgi:hypothetical protein
MCTGITNVWRYGAADVVLSAYAQVGVFHMASSESFPWGLIPD